MRPTPPLQLLAVSGIVALTAAGCASQGEANACHQAKEELLKAQTETEINALTRKVQVICDH